MNTICLHTYEIALHFEQFYFSKSSFDQNEHYFFFVIVMFMEITTFEKTHFPRNNSMFIYINI